MSLFPAYAPDLSKDVEDSTSCEEWCVPAALESQLLASDEEPPPAKCARTDSRPPSPAPEFYLDTELDYGNLRVSTLYYPGRPKYSRSAEEGGRAERSRAPRRRYWHGAPPPGAGEARAGDEAGARAAALRAALAADPADEDLWLRYVDFQEEWGPRGAGLEAARAAAAACDSRRVRDELHAARERHLPPERVRLELRDEVAGERRAAVRLELWARLVEALGAEGADGAAAAALAQLAADEAAYPRLVYVHGCVLRAAGLWERLVLGVELTAAMCFPPSSAFPPRAEPAASARRDAELHAREDEVCRSGLPLSAVWARVERLRAAAHWRPAPAGEAEVEGDPQRAPCAAAAAELLRPVRSARAAAALCVTLVRLARVPLAGGEHAARAAGPEPRAGEPALPEALAALLRTARRLPAAHPAARAPPHAARAALAPLLDPPHYFSDEDGFLRWTSALWEACCEWTAGARRLALVCWRLRWLHALARLADPPEARRLRREARALVRRLAPAAPEACLQLARLEADAAGAAEGARVARAAARAALGDAHAPPERALYAARVLAELEAAPAARWALCCAALRRPLPPDGELRAPPPAALEEEARDACARRCDELERGFAADAGEGEESDADVCAALLPGAGEWAAARAALASPAERERLLERLLRDLRVYRRGGAALQYGEQAACALALAGAGGAGGAAARLLLPAFPRSPVLALLCAGAPLWAGAPAPAPSARAALAAVLPLLVRAPLAQLTPGGPEAGRLARACARLARTRSPLLAALRLEAEARAPAHRTLQALYAALDAHPAHKWVYVRGAAWCGAEAAALCDALLERGLRLHALMDELRPPADLPADLPAGPADPPREDTARSADELPSDTIQ